MGESVIFPMIIQNLIGLSTIPLEGAKGIGSNRKILLYIYIPLLEIIINDILIKLYISFYFISSFINSQIH